MAGAFTGGVSPVMLKSMGIEWALAGHSERRTINKETDEYINAQCQMLVEQDMNVILCIGETEEEFEKNLVDSVCEVQLKKGLAGISKEQMKQVTIAYEPGKVEQCGAKAWLGILFLMITLSFVSLSFPKVWAIGTGKVATPEIAQDVHEVCRRIIGDIYDQETADSTRILYGGSVGPDSVDGLMAKPDIDGALVGGASLNADNFGRIINFVAQGEPALV